MRPNPKDVIDYVMLELRHLEHGCCEDALQDCIFKFPGWDTQPTVKWMLYNLPVRKQAR